MTEPEFVAHFRAVLDAIPESKISARQAALCVLEEFTRISNEHGAALAKVVELSRMRSTIAEAIAVSLQPSGVALVLTAEVTQTSALASPPRLSLVPRAEVDRG